MINNNEDLNQFKVLDPSSGAPMPRPIAPIECQCGCGIIFQPNRKDHIYLNKQHADFAYNHGKRKETSRIRQKEEAILAKNDKILHKHFICEKELKVVQRYLDVLKADGFQFAYNVGRDEKGDMVYWYSYRYYYTISQIEPKQVKIYKR
jgi:hypothetical protein